MRSPRLHRPGVRNRPQSYSSGMDVDEAVQLRKQWKAQGSPPCDHPYLEKEQYLGANTTDKVCTTCGAGFNNGRPVT